MTLHWFLVPTKRQQDYRDSHKMYLNVNLCFIHFSLLELCYQLHQLDPVLYLKYYIIQFRICFINMASLYSTCSSLVIYRWNAKYLLHYNTPLSQFCVCPSCFVDISNTHRIWPHRTWLAILLITPRMPDHNRRSLLIPGTYAHT